MEKFVPPKITAEKTEEKSGINLDRTLPFESGMEYNPEHYYRMLGESGYQDFLEHGVLRANPDRDKYERTYYFKGHPLARYTHNHADTQVFVEVRPTENSFTKNESGYPYSTEDISQDDQIRIYRVGPEGTELLFDSFED